MSCAVNRKTWQDETSGGLSITTSFVLQYVVAKPSSGGGVDESSVGGHGGDDGVRDEGHVGEPVVLARQRGGGVARDALASRGDVLRRLQHLPRAAVPPGGHGTRRPPQRRHRARVQLQARPRGRRCRGGGGRGRGRRGEDGGLDAVPGRRGVVGRQPGRERRHGGRVPRGAARRRRRRRVGAERGDAEGWRHVVAAQPPAHLVQRRRRSLACACACAGRDGEE